MAVFSSRSWTSSAAECASEIAVDSDILTLQEVAQTLGQAEDTVRGLLEEGQIPGRRIGDQWYVTRRKLLAFIEGDEPAAPAHPAKPPTPPDGNVFPFTKQWRCGKCNHVNEVDWVECAACGRPRSMPLINFRLS